jgi:hypothetical protein
MLSEVDYTSYYQNLSILDFLKETGYCLIQSTKPQTIGTALHDTPMGLAAYFIEKFQRGSDCQGIIENRFTKDELLNNIMVYWTSGCITSSVNFYFEFFQSENKIFEKVETYLNVPTAGLVFPIELTIPLKVVAQYYYNIQRWTIKFTGGHFAALEQPEELVKDVR